MRRIARSKRHERRAQRVAVAPVNRPAGRASILGRGDAWVSRFIDDLSHTGLAKATAIVAAILSVGAVIGTFVALKFDIEDRDLAREERHTARLERAWNRLLRPAVGNTGKGLALNILLEAGQSLNGVDLSCKRMGGELQKPNDDARSLRPGFPGGRPHCSDPPIIAGVAVADPRLLRHAKFSGADLRNWRIESEIPLTAAFDGAVFSDSILNGIRLVATDAPTVMFERSSLRGAELVSIERLALSRTDLTGTILPSDIELLFTKFKFLAIRHLNFMDIDDPVRCDSSQLGRPPVCHFVSLETIGFCLKTRRTMIRHLEPVRRGEVQKVYDFFHIPGIFRTFFVPRRACTHLEGTVEEPLLILTYDEAIRLRPMIYLGRPLPHP